MLAVTPMSASFTASATAYELEYHVRARHRSGGALRREGTADRPLVVTVRAGAVPRGEPITGKWWFWGGAAALAASAVAIPLLVRSAVDAGPQTIRVGERR